MGTLENVMESIQAEIAWRERWLSFDEDSIGDAVLRPIIEQELAELRKQLAPRKKAKRK